MRKALRFARALVFLPACAAPPTPGPVHVRSEAGAAPADADSAAGAGPCRCSWETDSTLAPVVCRKGQRDYRNEPCVVGERVIKSEGPLPPPSLGLEAITALDARQAWPW